MVVHMLTVDLRLPNGVAVALQRGQQVEHPDQVRIRSPHQHSDYHGHVHDEPADENRDSPSVFGESAERKGEECVRDAKADHHEAHAVDSDRAGHKGLGTKIGNEAREHAAMQMQYPPLPYTFRVTCAPDRYVRR